MTTGSLEVVKSQVCKVGEQLGDLALEGKIERLVVIRMDSEGQLFYHWIGCRATDVLGILQVAQSSVMRDLMLGTRGA